MNFLNKIKQFFIKYWKHILILLLIFIIAFGFRTLILRYDLMFEFDSYWHTRMNADWISSGEKPILDTMGTYHNANKSLITPQYSWFFWGTGVVAYKLVYLGAQYTQENWIALVRILPALYGALTALAIYLLFKWAYNSNIIGYIAGFIGAVMPAFIYRQMGGFYEEDAYGFLWMALGFAFFIKALKEPELTKEKIIYSIISGVMFAIMAFTWQVFVIVPLILEAILILNIIWLLIQKVDKKKIYAFLALFGIIFVITATFGTLAQTNWFGYQVTYAKGFLGISDASVNTQVSGSFTAAGVGEEAMGIGAFREKYGVFLIGILLYFISLGYAIYRRKDMLMTIVTFAIGMATMYLAYNKLKATYWFGLGISLIIAFAIAQFIIAIKDKKITINWQVIGIAFSIFLLLGGTASGIIYTYNHTPNIIAEPGWKEALEFMKNDLPENAKVFNWWSWGHWVTYMGHKRASTDNTNSDQQANSDFGAFIIEKDLNKALGIIKAYDSDYIALGMDSTYALGTYQVYANAKSDEKYNLNPLTLPYYCSQKQDPINKTTKFNCTTIVTIGNQRLTLSLDAKQMLSLPTEYTTKATTIFQNKIPVIYYTNQYRNILTIVDISTNETIGYKLWFNNSELKQYFKKVYDNGFVKIWEVQKESFKDIPMHMSGLNLEEIEEWNSKLYWLDENYNYNQVIE